MSSTTANGVMPLTSRASEPALTGVDPVQAALMEERLIVLDYNDKPIGEASKKTCHLMSNINPPTSLLHRAFSCFLFRPSDGKLLLQKRASEKITFPDMWTNTCCSHPLAVPDEMEVENQIGVRRAVQRKLNHELGIPADQVPLDDFVYITRIHYLAPSDGMWGEHEIDYVVFATANVTLDVNPNEVSEVQYVSKDELEALFQDTSLTFTPWFKLIAKSFLYKWWDTLCSRTAALSLLEGTAPNATAHPHAVEDATHIGPADATKSAVKVDVHTLKDFVTDTDRNEIIRF